MAGKLPMLAAAVGGAHALAVRQAGCSLTLHTEGSVSYPVGQHSSGQTRAGSSLAPSAFTLIDSTLTDAQGRGCWWTPPTTVLQCDVGQVPETGFQIGCDGSVSFNGQTTFYECATGEGDIVNVYLQPDQGANCAEITLTADGCSPSDCSGASSTGAASATESLPPPGSATGSSHGVGSTVTGSTSYPIGSATRTYPGSSGMGMQTTPGAGNSPSYLTGTASGTAPSESETETAPPGGSHTESSPGYATGTATGTKPNESETGSSSELPVQTPTATQPLESQSGLVSTIYSTTWLTVTSCDLSVVTSCPAECTSGAATIPGSVPASGTATPGTSLPDGSALNSASLSVPGRPTGDTTNPGYPSSSPVGGGGTPENPTSGHPTGTTTIPSYPSTSPGEGGGTPGYPTAGESSGTANAPVYPTGSLGGSSGPISPSQSNHSKTYSPITLSPITTQPATGTSGAPTTATQPTVSVPSPSSVNIPESCPGDVVNAGEFNLPALIIPIDSTSPNVANGTSFYGDVSSTRSTIFNFNIPSTDEGKTCNLIFLFPEQSTLETSSYTFSGSGVLDFSKLSSTADKGTTDANAPSVASYIGQFTVSPGNAYDISSFACPAGGALSVKIADGSSGDTSLRFFQDYNPCPIGLFITTS
ncbi:uncharacterized protein JN550_005218 [Neoarthrinium moseri]|uniref:uncharacterized protein n=1 Tax=Neoarthrinium moseri TaxID=1658444 RepID=UPI001FDD14B7|nr:uncharacterized protein JN550_005218 [Neoarthrinium moseri]KAI1870290.1 hypothetical protein JN550_005218 [Neoarthrinium moseri]